MLPPKRPPRTDSPRSGPIAWLDRHAHPESRASHYFNFAHSVLQLLPSRVTHPDRAAPRGQHRDQADVYSRSVDAALLLHQLEFDHPDLICVLEPNGPEHRLAQGELEEVRYLEMNLHLHERLWQQHQDRIFDEEEWEPWERRFQDEVVTAEMFPAVWTTERDYFQEEFARYVDAIVADELAHRAAATAAAGETPSLPQTLADFADVGPSATPAC